MKKARSTASLSKHDPVNNPAHYTADIDPTYEPIKVIEAWSLNFNLGNTVKYIKRSGKKENLIQDLKKSPLVSRS